MAAAAMQHMASNFAKLDKFKGVDFRRWQKKMHFLLSSMSMVYVLTTLIPEDGDDNPTVEQVRKRAKWDNDDYNVESSKKLWDSLQAKYMAEDVSSKKFLVSNFTNYKMIDSRPVLEQYNEFLGILGRSTQHKIYMDEAIQVSCIIDKLHPFWKDFKHTLKHKKKELTLIELGSHLRIEESLRVQDSDKPKSNNVVGPLVFNMVEHNNSSRNVAKLVTLNVIAKVLMLAAKPMVQAQRVQQMDDDVAWWVDSVATIHVCKDRCWFKTYESLNDESILHMGNELTTLVHGRGCIDLRAAIRLSNLKLKTLGKRGFECIFVGYAEHSNAFRFYVIKPNESVAINSIIESRDAIFDENRFYSVPKPSLRIPNGTEDIDGSVVLEEVTKEVVQGYACLREASRPSLHAPLSFDHHPSFIANHWMPLLRPWIQIEAHGLPTTRVNPLSPCSQSQAFDDASCADVELSTWTPKIFRPEFQLYLIEGTRDEVSDQHSYCFNVEDDPKAFDEAMKSHDVAFWKEAINDEMDSIMGNNTWVLTDLPPVARVSTIRLLIAMASIHNLVIHQMDVKTAFLNGDLDEKVYMNQPQGFIMPGNEHKVDLTKEFLSSRFSMKDMGEAIFNYFDSSPAPMDTSMKLMLNNGQAVSQLEYSMVGGCLMYVMTCTRSDIAFVVDKLSRYTSNPGT
ncbi:zinc finger, CCHC-type containing protein [Tanacetum coccineum]|uniref:Zinc finger, CCHC-type containing protein n=1 Tax=Tanacetum coccineum TaxID=301880 RepID=A0ABQ4YPA9_9ASTR